MSSTSRGGQRSPADFYETPSWPVHRLLERLPLPGGTWLESSAGEGGIIRAVNAVRKDVNWVACELREECKPILAALTPYVRIGSFLDWTPGAAGQCSVSINNVPFSSAMEFIEHTLAFAPIVIHLLRLNFLGSGKRNTFFQENCPDVFVVPDRISFTGDGKADSIEYGWFVWGRERGRSHGRIEVLDTTPVEQRR